MSLLLRIILTKWYVNRTYIASVTFAIKGFILTMWYVKANV
ncbi:TPA: hypothetical protein ACG3JX_001348 [Clostridioides difficile]